MTRKTNTFGQALRAVRLGYGMSDEHGAFIRLGDDAPTKVSVTLCPFGTRVATYRGDKQHVVWWESEEARKILDYIPALKTIGKIDKQIRFWIDKETGEKVEND